VLVAVAVQLAFDRGRVPAELDGDLADRVAQPFQVSDLQPLAQRQVPARKNYAGTSPITRASGKKKVILARYVRNKRLTNALHQQAFNALSGSPGARAYYDALRDRDISYNAALRQLGNRLVGILNGCLKTHSPYDEATAWNPTAGQPSEQFARSLLRATTSRPNASDPSHHG
jgi:hypothetical protein